MNGFKFLSVDFWKHQTKCCVPVRHFITKTAAPSVKPLLHSRFLFLVTSYCLDAVLRAKVFLRDYICLKMTIHAKFTNLQTLLILIFVLSELNRCYILL